MISDECCDAIIAEGTYRWEKTNTYKKLNIILKLEDNNSSDSNNSSSNNFNDGSNNSIGVEKRRMSKAEKKKNMKKNIINTTITTTINEIKDINILNKKDMLILIELFVNKDGKYQIIVKTPVDICKSYIHALNL